MCSWPRAPSSRSADQEVRTDLLTHNSEEQFSSGEGAILPLRDTWQYLETFLIVTTWGRVLLLQKPASLLT